MAIVTTGLLAAYGKILFIHFLSFSTNIFQCLLLHTNTRNSSTWKAHSRHLSMFQCGVEKYFFLMFFVFFRKKLRNQWYFLSLLVFWVFSVLSSVSSTMPSTYQVSWTSFLNRWTNLWKILPIFLLGKHQLMLGFSDKAFLSSLRQFCQSILYVPRANVHTLRRLLNYILKSFLSICFFH